jgi:MOSC domain-containing protein YiiM
MKVTSVNVGRVRPLAVGGQPVPSAIGKTPASGPVPVGLRGLAGDERAEEPEALAKAVYAYPSEHLPFWSTVRAQAGAAPWGEAVPPGLLGENLTLTGLLENRVWVGDVLRFAGCALAVSEPRLPCAKLNAALGFGQAARLMVQSGWCGFYLGVLEPGTLQAGEPFEVEPGPRDVRLDELFRALTGTPAA